LYTDFKDYFFLAAFFFPPFFFAAFFAAFFFMAMVRSPVLEWNTRAIPRWIGGRTTAHHEGTRPIRYALVQRARNWERSVFDFRYPTIDLFVCYALKL